MSGSPKYLLAGVQKAGELHRLTVKYVKSKSDYQLQ